MNSFYKKIALVCLVSLTANQVTQAFHFSDIGNWMQNNPKKTVAVMLGIYALMASTLFYKVFSTRSTQEQRARERTALLDRETKRSVHQSAIQEESDEYATYVDQACLACPTEREFNRLTGESHDVPARTDVRSLDTLSDADHKRLAELSPNPHQPGKSYYPPHHALRSEYIMIVRDQNKNIVGCLWYWHGYGDHANIHVFNVQGPDAEQIKKSLLKQLLHARKHDTTKYDIATYADGDSSNLSLVQKTIQEVDGQVRMDRRHDKESYVFRRNDPEVDDLFRVGISSKGRVGFCNPGEIYPRPGQVPSVQYYEDNDLRGLEERRARGRRILEMRRREQSASVADALVHESFADLRRAGDVAPASQV